MNAIRWDIAVSEETDRSVRAFLDAEGQSPEAGLPLLIERAVRSYLFERSAELAKAANEHLSEADIAAAVEEAVQWARTTPCGS